MQPKYILIFFVIIITLYAHRRLLRNAGSLPRYIRGLLGLDNSDCRRIRAYDYIRALAVIFVIGAHAVQTDGQAAGNAFYQAVLQLSRVLFFNCNPLFVMLSGALVLNQEETPVSIFYRKRVFKVVIPMAVYYLFYLYMGLYQSGLTNPHNLLDAVRRFLSGPSDWNPHFWLIYVVIALYLTAPYFKVMVQNMSDKLLLSFVVLAFVMNGALAWLPLLGAEFNFATILCGWESVFIFGYFWTRPCSSRLRRLFMILGIISFLFTSVVSCILPDLAEAFFNKAPTMLFMSGAIFAWFTGRESILKEPGSIVRLFGKYGFSILLIHWFILHQIVEERLRFSALGIGRLGTVVLTVFVTLVLSLLFALIFDHTAVLCVDTVCGKILEGAVSVSKKVFRKFTSGTLK